MTAIVVQSLSLPSVHCPPLLSRGLISPYTSTFLPKIKKRNAYLYLEVALRAPLCESVGSLCLEGLGASCASLTEGVTQSPGFIQTGQRPETNS